MLGIRSHRPGRRRLAVLGALAASALALTGCDVHPGDAAVVGSTVITQTQVDAVAHALCAANNQGAGVSSLPSRGARRGALQVLVVSALAHELGKKYGVTPDRKQVAAALAQDEPNLSTLPAADHAAFRAALKDYAEGQLILIDIGRKSLEQQGQSSVSTKQALAEGARLRDKWEAQNPVQVDPRFGTFEQGTLSAGDGSLSVPQSGRAVQGAKSDPSSTWAAGLPASQTCG